VSALIDRPAAERFTVVGAALLGRLRLTAGRRLVIRRIGEALGCPPG